MSCPMCKKPVSQIYRPFCSKRCADLDLARWIQGDYTIETEEAPEDGVETEAKPLRPH